MSAKKIYPNLACRLEFFVEDVSTGLPVPSLLHSDVSSAGYCQIADGVRGLAVLVSLTSSASPTDAIATGQFVTLNSANGHYAVDVPAGASNPNSDYVEAVVAFTGGHVVRPVTHEIDYALAVALSTSVAVTVSIPDDLDGILGYVTTLVTALPTSGHLAGSADAGGAAVLDSADQDQLDAILEAAGAGGTDWTDEERAEIRYRLGLTGTATAPAGSTPDPIVINPPDDEDQTTGYTITRDSSLARLPAVTVRVMMIESPADESGQFYSDGVQSIVSDDNAIAQMPLRKGATYLVWSGSQKNAITVAVPADAADTFALPSIVGRF